MHQQMDTDDAWFPMPFIRPRRLIVCGAPLRQRWLICLICGMWYAFIRPRWLACLMCGAPLRPGWLICLHEWCLLFGCPG
jgi:predicted amidophosphoribosyltransferase